MDAIERLANEIGELAAHLDSATQRLLARIRSFDEAGGWERQGAVSCAHWLAWRIGLDPATARERVRVARRLGELPRIDEALGRGELSYAKVRALTRVATPANEDRLLDLARHATGAQLERICRGYRQATQSLEDAGVVPEARSVSDRLLPGGMVKLEIVLSPDEASVVMKAIELAQERLGRERLQQEGAPEAATGERRPPTAPPASRHRDQHAPRLPSRADAVVSMAESFLAHGQATHAGACGDRHQVFVHLGEDVLGDAGAWAATLDDGTRVSAESLRRLTCDAGIVPTVTSATGAVLDVGRRTRTIPAAIRRALLIRDHGCRFPGCTHTRFLHGHHIQHWLHGGATRLDNLILLCTRHHRLLHEDGFRLEPRANDSVLVFRAPDGRELPRQPASHLVEDAITKLHEDAAERGLTIAPDTNLPWWDGAVPDYEWVVGSLMA